MSFSTPPNDGDPVNPEKDGKKPKRKYSKAGCRECKRRKMKVRKSTNIIDGPGTVLTSAIV